jgi:hypothetical protein
MDLGLIIGVVVSIFICVLTFRVMHIHSYESDKRLAELKYYKMAVDISGVLGVLAVFLCIYDIYDFIVGEGEVARLELVMCIISVVLIPSIIILMFLIRMWWINLRQFDFLSRYAIKD